MAIYFDQNGNLVDTEISESSNVFMEDPTENFYQPRMDISATQDFYQPQMDVSATQDFYQPNNLSPTQDFYPLDRNPTQMFYQPRNFVNAPQDFYQPDLTTLRGLDMNRFQDVSDMSMIDETTDDEQDQEYIDQVAKSNNPLKGIMDLLRNIPTPFNLVRRGLEALRGSESLSDFRNSSRNTVNAEK